MAGDWIKMRTDLHDDPTVHLIAAATKLDVYQVVGRLHAFWAWADKYAIDGRVAGATRAQVDKIVSKRGFAAALEECGWLEFFEEKSENFEKFSKNSSIFLVIPKHEKHNGKSAKERALKNQRQSKWRENVDGEASTKSSTKRSTSASTKTSTREEKRREDSISSSSGRENTETPKSPFIPGAVFEGPFTMPWGTQSPEGLARCKLTKFDEAEGEAEFEELDTGDRWCCFGSRFDRVKSRQRTSSG